MRQTETCRSVINKLHMKEEELNESLEALIKIDK